MKHLNSRKNTRIKCWTPVRTNLNPWSQFKAVKIELQRQPGAGRFYADQNYRVFWFEQAEDATWFQLRFG